MDKAWVWLPRASLEFVEGATNFVTESARRLGNPPEILCPCINCRNVCHQLIETVVEHLVIKGIFKWNSSVAEGRVSSNDPADVVHHVPLGPNASKVWVEVAKIGGASVWRPNSEIEYISDAIGTTIAWPRDKIVFL